MAGKGKRVAKFGKCKPLVKINNKSIFFWFIKGLKKKIKKNDKLIFIINQEHDLKFNLYEKIKLTLSQLKITNQIGIKMLEKIPSGPAKSVYEGIKDIKSNSSCVIINHDQYVDFKFPNKKTPKWDCFVPLYYNDKTESSYVKIKKKLIIKLKEKKMISNYASSGIYGFKDINYLKSILEKEFKKKAHKDGEYFIGPTINAMISLKKKVIPTQTKFKFDLGSIEGIKDFENYIDNLRSL